MIIAGNALRGRDFVMSAGQSNAAGLRDGNPAVWWPRQSRGVQPSVLGAEWIYTGARYGVDPVWHQMTPRATSLTELGTPTGHKRGHGGMSLGRRLQSYGWNPAIATYGVGATPISYWRDNTATWLTWLKARFDELTDATCRGFVFYEGESDATAGNPWRVPMNAIMVSVRAIWPHCPVVIVRLPITWSAPHLDDIQAEQDEFVFYDENAIIVRDDVATFNDGIHIDSLSTDRIYTSAADALWYINMMNALGLYIGAGRTPNAAPSAVAITSPTAGFKSVVGETLTVSGTCLDPNGNLTQVEAFNNVATSFGTDTTPPVTTFTLDHLLAGGDVGAASLTAVATDSFGLTLTSAAVAGTVYATQTDKMLAIVNATSPTAFYYKDGVHRDIGDAIDEWTDRTVNAAHATQVTDANQPVVSGTSKLVFTAANHSFLTLPASMRFSGASAITQVFGLKRNTRTAAERIVDCTLSYWRIDFGTAVNDQIHVFVGGGANYGTLNGVTFNDAPHLVWVRYDATQATNELRLRIWVDGTERAWSSMTGTIPNTNIGVVTAACYGAVYSGIANWLDHDAYLFGGWNSVLPDPDMAAIEAALIAAGWSA